MSTPTSTSRSGLDSRSVSASELVEIRRGFQEGQVVVERARHVPTQGVNVLECRLSDRSMDPHRPTRMRMQLRRFTRLTNGFSKKLDNLKAMVDVFFVWYNFCRPHQTLHGLTPAMEAGWTDHVWTVHELLTV